MLALLCGGQGRLESGSFDLVAKAKDPISILASAKHVLSEDPLTLYHRLPPATVAQNQYNQFFSVLLSLAHYGLIKDILPEQFAVAGYSVGEVAAFCLGGIWTTQQALEITWERARLMSSSCQLPCQLTFSMGLHLNTVEAVSTKYAFSLAIQNPDDFFVLGGPVEHVGSLCSELKELGAKRAEPLSVFIPSHTHYLSSAVAPFQRYISTVAAKPVNDDRILFSGLDGMRIYSSSEGIAKLDKAIAAPLDWKSTLLSLCEQGVTHVLDLGPGNALANMIKANYPHIAAYAVTDFQSIDGLRKWIGGVTTA